MVFMMVFLVSSFEGLARSLVYLTWEEILEAQYKAPSWPLHGLHGLDV